MFTNFNHAGIYAGFSLDLHLTPSDYLVTCNFTTSLLYNSLYSNDSNDENFSKILNFLNSKGNIHNENFHKIC